MVSAIAILAFIPWLDSSKVRSCKYRPLYRQFYWILIIDFIVLGYLGAQPATGIYLILGRLATLYYFLHFILVMPLIGFIEKPKPLPKSISEPVLSKEEQLAKSGQMA
jgi:ubiquinol-cytochrome c reductase cytochrome b subunit